MPTEDYYNKEADDIDEIQEEDRQERMKKEKAKARHINWKLYSESVHITNNNQGEKARTRKGNTILTDEVSTPENSLAINGVVTPDTDSPNLNNTSLGGKDES